MTDRDPTNPAALIPLVADLMKVAALDYDATPEEQEAAAKALLDALLDQGVLTPEEHGGAHLEELDPDHEAVNVRVPEFGWVQVALDGSTEVYPD